MPCKSLSGNPIYPGVAGVGIMRPPNMTTSGTGPAGANGAELSVITPVYNEANNIEALLTRLVPVLEGCAASIQIIFFDDGSTDDTLKCLRAAHHMDPRVRALSLSRNFGKEIAIA